MTSDPTSTVLDEIGHETLRELYLAKKPRLWEGLPAEPNRFDWPALNRVLSEHQLDPARMRLVKQRQTCPPERYTTRTALGPAVVPERLHELLAEGASLVIDAVDQLHEGTGRTAGELERLVRATVQTNLYASWTGAQGFGLHFDDQDVLVVQLSGAKRWRFYPPTHTAVLLRDPTTVPPPEGEPEADVVLRAGDVLFLPRGWWHGAAAGEGEHSLHLTHTMIPTTGIDLMTWLVRRLHTEECFRLDLPTHGDGAARDDHARRLARSVSEALATPGLLDTFLAERDGKYRARVRTSLPVAVDPPAPAGDRTTGSFRLVSPWGHVVEGDQPRFDVAGLRFPLDPVRLGVVRLLLDGRAHERGELESLADAPGRDDIHAFLAELVRAGVVAPV